MSCRWLSSSNIHCTVDERTPVDLPEEPVPSLDRRLKLAIRARRRHALCDRGLESPGELLRRGHERRTIQLAVLNPSLSHEHCFVSTAELWHLCERHERAQALRKQACGTPMMLLTMLLLLLLLLLPLLLLFFALFLAAALLGLRIEDLDDRAQDATRRNYFLQ